MFLFMIDPEKSRRVYENAPKHERRFLSFVWFALKLLFVFSLLNVLGVVGYGIYMLFFS